ncbi:MULTISPECIES: geranylgeranylglyceryl/heptaprenylglyceryl phosphate synthase [unclassified Algibacter]|uniref:geranylgeranylglyceryl/heptaprenylglyceryl phosphate synthase n=1 Tax=unclassified Algibacter TaxID=2615009 RepID=UPI00131C5097|nr:MULTISPECIES: geranylgeranylglyceryl/heptaprenylglyceryl phosphate synthase [unclassified Algibacter]MCL5126952.1 geranylgeranylglyceryl/heptaprenylglyceryl phosphate synthase [Algibacter sp. L4_22]
MINIYSNIQGGKRQLAVLIDPDKFLVEKTGAFIEKINTSIATHIFVGGSIVDDFVTNVLVKEIKKHTKLPVVLFPGDVTQITKKADAILFLSLISGRNPEYLIGKHVEAVSKLRDTKLEIISTGYILVESGKETAVQQVTETLPMPDKNTQNIIDTAKAGELLGMKLIYLEAGSGADFPVSETIISKVKKEIEIPLIVGGGIRNLEQLEKAYQSGADLVVIGTAFEEDELFFNALKK